MKVKIFLKKIIIPIREEIVFFFFCMLLLLPRTLMFPIIRFDQCIEDWTQYNTLRFVSIGVLFSYLFTLLVHISKSRFVKGVIYFVLYVLFFLNIYLAFNFKATVSPNTLVLLFETTPLEAQDFLNTYATSNQSVAAYTLTVILLCINILLEYRKRMMVEIICSYKFIYKIHPYLLSCLLIFLVGGLYSSQTVCQLIKIKKAEEMGKWNSKGLASMDLITGFVYSVRYLDLMGDVLSLAEESTKKAVAHDESKFQKDSCNIVLVIGESYIKRHSSLYGYHFDTSPRLEKEKKMGRLFVFSDVVTSSGGTSLAIKNCMSCNSVGHGEKWYDNPFFPALFKKAGYDVFFWDNQYNPTSSANFDFSLNSYLHNPTISSLSYTAWHEQISRIDGDIVDDFKKYISKNGLGKNNLVIFHLQGQHFEQETRYPHTSEFMKFTSNDIDLKESWMTEKKRMAIAHYDNCTLYNDSVIASIISLFKDKPTAMVYFSDHGECIYDIGDYKGRELDLFSHGSDYIRYLFEIPFVVWCSDEYMARYPEVIYKLMKASEKPLMTDIICHILMTLGGVKSNIYDSSRDVLSDDYICPPRIVNESINYDEIIK